jgi:hypothetical protein
MNGRRAGGRTVGLGFRGVVRRGVIAHRGGGKPEQEARAERRLRAAASETAGSDRRGRWRHHERERGSKRRPCA